MATNTMHETANQTEATEAATSPAAAGVAATAAAESREVLTLLNETDAGGCCGGGMCGTS